MGLPFSTPVIPCKGPSLGLDLPWGSSSLCPTPRGATGHQPAEMGISRLGEGDSTSSCVWPHSPAEMEQPWLKSVLLHLSQIRSQGMSPAEESV